MNNEDIVDLMWPGKRDESNEVIVGIGHPMQFHRIATTRKTERGVYNGLTLPRDLVNFAHAVLDIDRGVYLKNRWAIHKRDFYPDETTITLFSRMGMSTMTTEPNGSFQIYDINGNRSFAIQRP